MARHKEVPESFSDCANRKDLRYKGGTTGYTKLRRLINSGIMKWKKELFSQQARRQMKREVHSHKMPSAKYTISGRAIVKLKEKEHEAHL